jgi:hypothetical protein
MKVSSRDCMSAPGNRAYRTPFCRRAADLLGASRWPSDPHLGLAEGRPVVKVMFSIDRTRYDGSPAHTAVSSAFRSRPPGEVATFRPLCRSGAPRRCGREFGLSTPKRTWFFNHCRRPVRGNLYGASLRGPGHRPVFVFRGSGFHRTKASPYWNMHSVPPGPGDLSGLNYAPLDGQARERRFRHEEGA